MSASCCSRRFRAEFTQEVDSRINENTPAHFSHLHLFCRFYSTVCLLHHLNHSTKHCNSTASVVPLCGSADKESSYTLCPAAYGSQMATLLIIWFFFVVPWLMCCHHYVSCGRSSHEPLNHTPALVSQCKVGREKPTQSKLWLSTPLFSFSASLGSFFSFGILFLFLLSCFWKGSMPLHDGTTGLKVFGPDTGGVHY